jgi:poly(A) polymerase
MIIPSDKCWISAVEITQILQNNGYQAYFVGGCVRDILLNIIPEDYDIATSARPKEIMRHYPEADTFGIRFGVLKVKKEGYKFQIATFRRDDPKGDGRHPQRIFFSDLQGDAERRDFTINAIYFDPILQTFRDPLGGRKDLENRILRIIGEPKLRLREDYLRILRAIRFASKYDLTIERDSLTALKECAIFVKDLSSDRIREELTRIFLEGNVKISLKMLQETSILAILWDIFLKFDFLYEETQISLAHSRAKLPVEVWSAFFSPWKHIASDIYIEEAMITLKFPRTWKKAIWNSLKK